MFYVLILVLAFCLLVPVVIHNGLVTKRNDVRNAFATIDAQLKKRWDLIPQLVATVKGYAGHERGLFENLASARREAMMTAAISPARLEPESHLSSLIPQTLALAEAYPELKASEQFMNLQRNLTEVEAQIAAARRAYNAAIMSYNNSVEMFPSSLIASAGNFQRMPHFEIPVEERRPRAVDL